MGPAARKPGLARGAAVSGEAQRLRARMSNRDMLILVLLDGLRGLGTAAAQEEGDPDEQSCEMESDQGRNKGTKAHHRLHDAARGLGRLGHNDAMSDEIYNTVF